MVFSRFRSLLGMLESYRPVVGLGEVDMYFLYDHQFRRGVGQPSLSIVATLALLGPLEKWRERLVSQAGCFFTSVVDTALRPATTHKSTCTRARTYMNTHAPTRTRARTQVYRMWTHSGGRSW